MQSRSYSRLAAPIIIAAVVIAGGIFASSYFGTARTVTFTSTQTAIPTDPATLTTSNNDWKFEVHLNATVVTEAQEINYTCYLTNISGQNQSIRVAYPLSNPAIDTEGGQQAWAYEQSATNSIQVIPAGHVLFFQLTMPVADLSVGVDGVSTTRLQAGQTYVLTSSPNIGTDGNAEVPFGQYLQLNATIQVVSG